MVLEALGRSLDSAIRKIRRLPKVDKEAINALIQELQRALLSSDVKVEIVFETTEKIKKEAMNTQLDKSIRRRDYIIKIIHDELINLLGGTPAPIRIKPNKQNIILMVGIQGSGKTTTVGKLANYYKGKGYTIGVVCGDNWRPGAYEQLQQLCEPINVKVFGNPSEKNTLKMVLRQTKQALKEDYNIIIVDTAGRHKEEKELMKEIENIEKAVKPDEVILVIDGTLGQQAYTQALEFSKATRVGAIIVTKLDGTAKGGGALSAVAATNAPIKFIGIGEKIDEFELFEPTKFVGTLLGVPDLEGLVKKVQDAMAEPDPEMVKRMMRGKFTLEDLYIQLKAIKKMGRFSKILGMLGVGNIPEEAKEMAQTNIEKWEIVLNSMTKEEKETPKIIKKSRKRRIAIGSGSSYTTINKMLDQYNQMKTMMKKFMKLRKKAKKGRGGLPGLPPGFDLPSDFKL
jgi:signal recognition particle subunit SRP54